MEVQDNYGRNLRVLQKLDQNADHIFKRFKDVGLYQYDDGTSDWVFKKIRGALTIYHRAVPPDFGLILSNTQSKNDFLKLLHKDIDIMDDPATSQVMVRISGDNIYGFWFESASELTHFREAMYTVKKQLIKQANVASRVPSTNVDVLLKMLKPRGSDITQPQEYPQMTTITSVSRLDRQHSQPVKPKAIKPGHSMSIEEFFKGTIPTFTSVTSVNSSGHTIRGNIAAPFKPVVKTSKNILPSSEELPNCTSPDNPRESTERLKSLLRIDDKQSMHGELLNQSELTSNVPKEGSVNIDAFSDTNNKVLEYTTEKSSAEFDEKKNAHSQLNEKDNYSIPFAGNIHQNYPTSSSLTTDILNNINNNGGKLVNYDVSKQATNDNFSHNQRPANESPVFDLLPPNAFLGTGVDNVESQYSTKTSNSVITPSSSSEIVPSSFSSLPSSNLTNHLQGVGSVYTFSATTPGTDNFAVSSTPTDLLLFSPQFLNTDQAAAKYSIDFTALSGLNQGEREIVSKIVAKTVTLPPSEQQEFQKVPTSSSTMITKEVCGNNIVEGHGGDGMNGSVNFLTREQLKQAFIHCLNHNEEFLNEIHKAYIESLNSSIGAMRM